MQHIAQQLEEVLDREAPRLEKFTAQDWEYSYAPGKWTQKEILGHLVDSALNNIQRFVRVQHQTAPHIVYYQDDWVRISAYRNYEPAALLNLWETLNRHICFLLQHADTTYAQHVANTGKGEPELHTFEWLAQDYIHHMAGHLKQLHRVEKAGD